MILAITFGLITGEKTTLFLAIGALLGLLVLHERLILSRDYLFLIIDKPYVNKPINAGHVSPDLLTLILDSLEGSLNARAKGTLHMINLRTGILKQCLASLAIPVFLHERAEVLRNELTAITRLMHSNLA